MFPHRNSKQFISNKEFDLLMNLNGDKNENMINLPPSRASENNLLFPGVSNLGYPIQKQCKLSTCLRATTETFCSSFCAQTFYRIEHNRSQHGGLGFQSESRVFQGSSSRLEHQFGSISQMRPNFSLAQNRNVFTHFGTEPVPQDYSNQKMFQSAKPSNKFFEIKKGKGKVCERE